MPQRLNNYVQTTLASGCTNSAGTISVVSAAGFPTSGNFMLRIDDPAPATTFEYVECTGVSGTTFTVTRGQEGTTGIAHGAGAIVGNDITAGMLSRGYVERSYRMRARNTSSTVAATTPTKIHLDTIDYDPNNNFDNVTNFRYTAPVTGYYLVTVEVVFYSVGSGANFGAFLYKNGAAIDAGGTSSGAISSPTVTIASIYALTAGDYLEVFADSSTGTAATFGNSTNAYSSLAVHFLSIA